MGPTLEHQELLSLLPGLSVAVGGSNDVVLLRWFNHAADPGSAAAALQDVAVAGGIRAPEILPPTAWGDTGTTVWAAWPFVDGVPLTLLLQRCAEEGAVLPVGVAGRIVMDAAGALAVLHRLVDAGGNVTPVVHGGLGLDSLWVGMDGVTYLTDAGMARARARLLEPDRPQDLSADVLALGHVMYAAFSARPVPHGTPGPLDVRLVQPNVPASVANVVQRATHPNVALRPSNAMVLVVGLESALRPVGGPGDHSDVSTLLDGLFPAHHPMRMQLRDALVPYGGTPAAPPPLPTASHQMAAMPAGTASGRTLTMQQILSLGLPGDATEFSSPELAPVPAAPVSPAPMPPVGGRALTARDVLAMGIPEGAVEISAPGVTAPPPTPVTPGPPALGPGAPREITGIQPRLSPARTEVQFAAVQPPPGPPAPPRPRAASTRTQAQFAAVPAAPTTPATVPGTPSVTDEVAWQPQSLSSMLGKAAAENSGPMTAAADPSPDDAQLPVSFNISVDGSLPPIPSMSLPPVVSPPSHDDNNTLEEQVPHPPGVGLLPTAGDAEESTTPYGTVPRSSDPVPQASMPWGALPPAPDGGAPQDMVLSADASDAAQNAPPAQPDGPPQTPGAGPSNAAPGRPSGRGKRVPIMAGILVATAAAAGVAVWQVPAIRNLVAPPAAEDEPSAPAPPPANVAAAPDPSAPSADPAQPAADPAAAPAVAAASGGSAPASGAVAAVPTPAAEAKAPVAADPAAAPSPAAAEVTPDAGVVEPAAQAAADPPAQETKAEKKARLAAEKKAKVEAAKEKKRLAAEARKAEKERKAAEKKARTIGTLALTVPDGATVYVDGKKKGTAPLAAPLELKKGKHKVRVVLKKQKLDKKGTVSVVPGEAVEFSAP